MIKGLLAKYIYSKTKLTINEILDINKPDISAKIIQFPYATKP